MRAITIDLSRETGVIKPLHGVNNGPLGYGSLVDVSHHFRAAGFPLVRLHDPNYPHPREIDIHAIFPDFAKDPHDPASYDFARSDYYIRTVLGTGAKIVYRLGESIEHTPDKYYVHPPADYAKWAQICLGIIRHYNQGWANGFHYGIEYWEIWNEADGAGPAMWSGTALQYYDLYRVVAPLLKAFDPSLKIGGYAAANVKFLPGFFPNFMQMCVDEKLPLDFFSWHSYNDNPELVRELSIYVRENLDRCGYSGTESHYNEWSFFDADWTTIFVPGNEHYRRDMFERGKGTQGASYAAAVLSLMQELPIDAANYYDGQPSALFCGLFDYYGVPTKTYHIFRQFNELLQYKRRVPTSASETGVYLCAAATPESGGAALISNWRGYSGYYDIAWSGAESLAGEWAVEEYRTDNERTGQLVGRHKLAAGRPLKLFLARETTLFLKIVRD